MRYDEHYQSDLEDEIREQAWQRKRQRDCQGYPLCGCSVCEPEPDEEPDLNEQDE